MDAFVVVRCARRRSESWEALESAYSSGDKGSESVEEDVDGRELRIEPSSSRELVVFAVEVWESVGLSSVMICWLFLWPWGAMVKYEVWNDEVPKWCACGDQLVGVEKLLYMLGKTSNAYKASLFASVTWFLFGSRPRIMFYLRKC